MPGSAAFGQKPVKGPSRVFAGEARGDDGDAMSETRIRAQQTDEGAMLVLAGDVDLSCVGALWGAAAEALATRPERLVVDVSAVTFLTSSVLGTLIRIQSAGQEQGTAVLLRDPTPIVQRLLLLSGLHAVLPVEPSPAAQR
jgi:anti-anti-sigma factor